MTPIEVLDVTFYDLLVRRVDGTLARVPWSALLPAVAIHGSYLAALAVLAYAVGGGR